VGKTLVIAEKPSVGRDLAGALPGTFKQSQDKTHLVGDEYIVSSASPPPRSTTTG
jgi:DNA topoisomerase IA